MIQSLFSLNHRGVIQLLFLTEEEIQEKANEYKKTYEETKTLAKRAERLINLVTRNFYLYNDFQTDNKFRKDCVKEAVIGQMDFFNNTGAMTTEERALQPDSISIGRTTVTNRSSSNNSRKALGMISDYSMMNLQATGLLFRGVES